MIRTSLVLVLTVIVCSISCSSSANASLTVDIDLTGFQSVGTFGDASNSSVTVNIGPLAAIESVEWINLDFGTLGFSFQEEFTLALNDSAMAQETGTFWHFQPAPGRDFPGNYVGSGEFNDLDGVLGSGPFTLLGDGQLVVSIYDSFDDSGVDAVVNSGILRVTYSAAAIPEPATGIFMLAVAAGCLKFRRRLAKS